MKNLFLTIGLIVLLFILFRYFKKFNINSFHAVVINYYVCILTGLIFLQNSPPSGETLSLDLPWVRLGVLAGSLFVPCFYLMALTVEKVNITASAVANKMSLVMPVLFSLLFLKRGPDNISIINILGIVLTVAAILMTTIKKEKNAGGEKSSIRYMILLPVAVFLLGGTIDTIINYTNYVYLKGNHQTTFPLIMFSTACFFGTVFVIIKMIFTKNYIQLRDIAGGIILGIPNFFSLYFLIKTLGDFNHDAAVVYPVANIGIIVVAALVAVVLFKEKLSSLNLTGICFSVISIILVFW